MKEMKDVSQLKQERGDCKVFHDFMAAGNDGKKVGTLPQANHPKDAVKHLGVQQDYGNIDI
jgi:hypothetical protein